VTAWIRNIACASLLVPGLVPCGHASGSRTNSIPSLQEALAARQDVWGLAAMRQTNGPSYEFFAGLLPPLRYVNAGFRYYPIVLSAVAGPWKARLVSNGSAINARAGLQSWKDAGTPVSFGVGGGEIFGSDPRRLDGPHLERGFLPIVSFSYEHEHRRYEEQAFAAVEPALAMHGVAFVRFGSRGGGSGEISAAFETSVPLRAVKGTIQTTNSEVIAWFDGSWQWNASEKRLVAPLASGGRSVLALATKPMSADIASSPSIASRPLSRKATFEAEHRRCVGVWQNVVNRGMHLEVPEPRVNDAWRALILSLFTEAAGNDLNYSAGNAYDRIYEAETGDAVGALMLWGHEGEAAAMIRPLLDYDGDKFKFHNAGFKLQTLARYYWLTRDGNYVRSVRAKWEAEIQGIISGRERDSGLFPREQYCGDIFQDVYSLHANGAAWRGLRDFGAVLADMGDAAEAQRLAAVAVEFRQAILAAAAKSERTDVQPNFIPVALFGEEKPYETLTASKMGSYWSLMAPYMLGSGMFGPGSVRERAIVDYLQERGGLCMGMIRFDQHSGLFANENGVDDLYGLRYVVKLLELDEVDRALVSFYGKLAQGLTRETFVGAEGTGLKPLDEFGRPMYLPPNSTAQAYFLWMLRYLLVQDWDLDDNGAPETLRLCFATPKRWLADGGVIKLDRAPTAFGPVSLRIQSRLKRGEVVADVALPARNPAKQTLLRVRVPDGWRITGAKSGNTILTADERGTVDISSLKGNVTIHFQVSKTP
jgi:hypothetical protein